MKKKYYLIFILFFALSSCVFPAENYDCIKCSLNKKVMTAKPNFPAYDYLFEKTQTVFVNQTDTYYIDKINKRLIGYNKKILNTKIFNSKVINAEIKNSDAIYTVQINRLTGDIKIYFDDIKSGVVEEWFGTCSKISQTQKF